MTFDIVAPRIAAQTSLDRRGDKRTDAQWIAGRLSCPEARLLALVDLRVPIIPSPDRRSTALRWLKPGDQVLAGANLAECVYLGEQGQTPVFAINLPPHEAIGSALAEAMHPLVDLRSLALQGVLPQDDLLIAAQARAICAWHAVNRCCGRCGACTRPADGGWRRHCRACGLAAYPRTDPAVIMLITRGDFALLGHEHRFPENMYSTLAGFIEAGDDIENAVRREVMEEAGIAVGAVRYVASQPWPFPHSLMIGCWGEALPGDIRIDASELADVRWFRREELAAMIEGRHPDGLFAPPSISMAHTLIRGFLAGALG